MAKKAPKKRSSLRRKSQLDGIMGQIQSGRGQRSKPKKRAPKR